jgi:hypothetical protein
VEEVETVTGDDESPGTLFDSASSIVLQELYEGFVDAPALLSLADVEVTHDEIVV